MTRIDGDTNLQTEALEDLVSAVNYRRWLCSLAVPHFGADVLEIGSGLGHFAAEWADMGVAITASEAAPERLAILRERFAGDQRVSVRELGVPITERGEHTNVVAYNVLEHIEDHIGALRSFAGLVRPGGTVLLIVPAFEFAMSRFDRAIGHHRRYRVPQLADALTSAGLVPEQCRYINGPGLLAWWLTCRVLGGRPKAGAMLSAYDRVYVPIERRIESRVRPPFGQSVFAVARRPG
ncbi:class I SAM-dependent methyltransferase [Saccharopolyspora sp. HNM0983]|uniref:Class I SAM-dependent methyltransferase n=1 Tax=Saccharopolyspora montiporae TaxID=2781240 RepID=A0A929G1N7_9PSEU|nr:class I SAM-dependent methyltransferase [Saccharopolyspora sp. HNM0983]MBE9376042.1 class I SAM-dependent methyltransferase [Saccharopolyspora sp. HNM0983]